MAITTDQISALEQYKSLSTHVVGILDGEAEICSEKRQLASSNTVALNDLYASIVVRMKEIVLAVSA